MASNWIEGRFLKSAAYIDQVFEEKGRERGGHHNFVAEQYVSNILDDFSDDYHDKRLLAKLKWLDNPDILSVSAREQFQELHTPGDTKLFTLTNTQQPTKM